MAPTAQLASGWWALRKDGARNKHSTGARPTHLWLCQLCRCLPSLIPVSVPPDLQNSFPAYFPNHSGETEFAWSKAHAGSGAGQLWNGEIGKAQPQMRKRVHEVPTCIGKVAMPSWDSQTALSCVSNA